MNRKKYMALLWASGALALLHGGCVLAIPLAAAGESEAHRLAALAVAGLFWGTDALQLVLVFVTRRIRLQLAAQPRGKSLSAGPIGLFAFNRNWEGLGADIALGIGVVLQGLCAWKRWGAGIFWSSLFVCVVSFHLHCLFNGRNYRYGKLWRKRDKGV